VVVWDLSLRLEPEAVRGVCDRLREVERYIRERERDIPAASMALAHIVRAMELVGCFRPGYGYSGELPPELEKWRELERRALERGIIIE
jgi:hypothetical protein